MFYSLIRSGVDFYGFTAALSNKALKEPGLVVICLSAGLASYVAVENVRRLCLLVAVDLAFISYALFFKATPPGHRRIPLHAIHLQIFRHITQIYLEIR